MRRRLACVLHPSDEILESDPIWQLLPDMKPLQEEQVCELLPDLSLGAGLRLFAYTLRDLGCRALCDICRSCLKG